MEGCVCLSSWGLAYRQHRRGDVKSHCSAHATEWVVPAGHIGTHEYCSLAYREANIEPHLLI